MKYKIIFIILSLLFLSGCDATYDLDISYENLEEKTSIIERDYDRFYEDDTANYFYDIYSKMPLALFTDDNIINPEGNGLSFSKVEGIKYYNSKLSSDDVGITYDGKFKIDDYEYSTIANYAAPFMKYEVDGNKISLNSKALKMIFDQAPTLDNLKVNIKVSDYRVIRNNADEKSGNVYVWNITRNNVNKKNINLELSYSNIGKIFKGDVNKILKNSSNAIYIVIISIVILVIVLFVFNYIQGKRDEINKL